MRVSRLYVNSSGAKSLLRFKPKPAHLRRSGFLLRLTMFNPMTVGKAWRDNTQSQRTVASQLEQLMKHSQASRDAKNHIAPISDDAMNS